MSHINEWVRWHIWKSQDTRINQKTPLFDVDSEATGEFQHQLDVSQYKNSRSFLQSHRSEKALFQVDFDSKATGEFQHQLDISQ